MNNAKNSSTYLMHDPREAARLAEKVDAADWVDQHVAQLLDRTAGDVLDVGCGPGVLAAEAARRLNDDRQVTGVDLHADRFASSSAGMMGSGRLPANLTLRVGKAEDLPFEDGTFGLAWCRFLLEYLPDKPRALAEMVRVLRPGGRLLLQDLDGQLLWHDPPDPELEATLSRVMPALARGGFDPFVGRKLRGLALAAGLEVERVEVAPYHLYAGRIDEINDRLWQAKLAIAQPAVAAVIGDKESERLCARFMDYLRDDATLTYSVLFTVLARKPA